MVPRKELEDLLQWLRRDQAHQEKEMDKINEEWLEYQKENKYTKGLDFLSSWRQGMSWYAEDMIEKIQYILSKYKENTQ